MAGYAKEFLVDALCHRYKDCFEGSPQMAKAYRDMASNQYDVVGKDKFRVYASLDADAIKKFKAIKI